MAATSSGRGRRTPRAGQRWPVRAARASRHDGPPWTPSPPAPQTAPGPRTDGASDGSGSQLLRRRSPAPRAPEQKTSIKMRSATAESGLGGGRPGSMRPRRAARTSWTASSASLDAVERPVDDGGQHRPQLLELRRFGSCQTSSWVACRHAGVEELIRGPAWPWRWRSLVGLSVVIPYRHLSPRSSSASHRETPTPRFQPQRQVARYGRRSLTGGGSSWAILNTPHPHLLHREDDRARCIPRRAPAEK